MTDQQISDFISQARPDFRHYYYNSLVPSGYDNSDAGMLSWARQHLSEGHDIDQFNNFVNTQSSSTPQNNMPLNGIDELIIDPNTGLPINPTPGVDPAGGTSAPTWTDLVTGTPQDTGGGTSGQPTSQTGGGGTPMTGGSVNTPWVPTGGYAQMGDGTGFQQAPFPSGVGGNYQQVQNAIQSGQFGTVGQTNQSQLQQSGQQQNQQTASTQQQQQNQTSQQTGQTSQNQQTTGTTGTTGTETQNINQTQQAIDALGFGALLQDQAGGVYGNDAERMGFLKDVMNTGGTGFQSQLDQGIRQALSGPQVTGAGDSARARMGGYAAADIGRNNLNQRLAAAQQLSGPTGLAQLSTAANPYIGQQTTGTNTANTNAQQTTNANTNTTGSSSTLGNISTDSLTSALQNMSGSTTGWQSLLGPTNESHAGATAAQSSQAGAGNIPEGQPVKTGGCVLCTAAIELGLFRNKRVLREAINYKLGKGWKKFRLAARGYWAVFGPFANWLLDHPRVARTLYPMARMVVYEELRQAGRKLPFKAGAWLVHWIGDAFCRLVGLLPVSGHVTQPRINAIARRENIIFNVRN